MARKDRRQSLSSTFENMMSEEIVAEDISPLTTSETPTTEKDTTKNEQPKVEKEPKKEKVEAKVDAAKIAETKKTESNEVSKAEESYEISQASPFLSIRDKQQPTNIRRTFTVDSKLSEKIDKMVEDPATGKKFKGSKGLIVKFINNAITREMVEIGFLPKSALDNLEDYE
ncbi:hypothetical protein Q5427_11515 [Brochothrix thermosphacta]|uniref:hypothetical protein n=1 Tax=Brochothrix thermosphacta TaxID=2756 RepID=UPI002712C6A5|nr:hypothetical protein [Brochothrix thermosphacta]MDO7864918.1 hypothetical protein [Brochothrix thermosphacta]